MDEAGAAAFEYSSGGRSSRRLNHGGDRQANAALHRIVFTRLRHDPRTQAYYERRSQEGKTRHEIEQCWRPVDQFRLEREGRTFPNDPLMVSEWARVAARVGKARPCSA
ncbi:transposase [Streptomyces sp. NPDC058755]|uniref:transposase n=1 Tax=Streptomyces sp. NPDC058755 TaxID=3346624 RepID=UPI0036C09754